MTFSRLLSEALASEYLPATEDVLAVGLPLLHQLQDTHRSGMVSKLGGLEHVDFDGDRVGFDPEMVQLAKRQPGVIDRLNPLHTAAGIEVRARTFVDYGTTTDQLVLTSDDVHDDPDPSPRPMFLVGYRSWEQAHGHHDELTDIQLVGLLLTSYAVGLDLDLPSAVHDLAINYRHLTQLNSRIHPVVAGVLSDMVAPDRHQRPDDVAQVIATLQHHRDLPSDLDLSVAYEGGQGWTHRVLEALRQRVFDTTRRNRALYFRSSATTMSLTESSVPLLLNESRIRPDSLLTWNASVASTFGAGKPVDIERWCRFEENPHLTAGLDKLIANERKLRAEHGQGRLHLVIAFLRWYDPQNNEIVNSPLLIKPASLIRKKGVHTRYLVDVDDEAEVNPVLRHVLKLRFDIDLIDRISCDLDSIRSFVTDLEDSVRSTAPALRIELIEKPQIDLIRRRAQLRVAAYHRRRSQALATSGRWRRQDHSYNNDGWRPLGKGLYHRFVAHKDLPLRDIAGAEPTVRKPPQMAEDITDADTSRTTTNYNLSTSDVTAQRWEVDLCSITLAPLGTRRTTISRDYEALREIALADKPEQSIAGVRFSGSPFNEMFSPTPRSTGSEAPAAISLDQLLVLPADAAQSRAVRRGARGDSFIIQGPPGTGKSQTITNLIASSVAEGRRVLFVCEKRAALDVVAHRLDQVGLDALVATIHDSQADRRAFISDLGHTYNSWIKSAPTPPVTGEGRDELLTEATQILRPLERSLDEIVGLAPGTQHSIRILIERLVMLRASGIDPSHEAPSPQSLPSVDTWLTARPALDRLTTALVSAGLSPNLADHPALGIRPEALGTDQHLEQLRTVGTALDDAIQAVQQAFGPGVSPGNLLLTELFALANSASTIANLQAHSSTAVLDPSNRLHTELQTMRRESVSLQSAATNHSEGCSNWTRPLNAQDTTSALAIALDKEGSTFGFLNGRWRSTQKAVRAAYNFASHQIEPSVTAVLQQLQALHRANEAVTEHSDRATARLGTADLNSLHDLADRLVNNDVLELAFSGGRGTQLGDVAIAALQLKEATEALANVEALTLDWAATLATQLGSAPLALERPLLAWADLADADQTVVSSVLEAARAQMAAASDTSDTNANTIDVVEHLVLRSMLDELVSRGIGAINGAQLNESVERLVALYQRLLKANAHSVATHACVHFREQIEFSDSSMAGRSDEDKGRKRSYNAGRKLLEREFQKKMRFRSIRDLAGGDSGLVVRDLKPIWLMSPLSVSDTLPLDDELFDVVIFDEASQIPVEDAIPTLFRSRQIIVVGDRMQLPPTRFFSAEADEEDEIIVDEDGHRLSISLEADSFLTQADLSLDSTMLTWHYRSRFESLIAYSNHAFYDARLATVPDQGFDRGRQEEILVNSPDDARQNLQATIDNPISFHKMTNGQYKDRTNELEADYIAELVRSLLSTRSATNHQDYNQDDGTRLSIGIVAFSEAQQQAIELALEELATLDSEFAHLLEAEQSRTDDSEFVGLFVKNLENVQGDERDLIIMSVCYAPGPDGKLRMNFGPINQAGGERRLNVIFSRAKRNMAIVSSIYGSQITNTHNDGASNLARFLDYASAESQGLAINSDTILEGLRPSSVEETAQRHDSPAALELAARLRARGWSVDARVGRSVFTIDVAVRGDDGYLLGILIDPGAETEAAAGRLVAEAGVLKAFGWPITRIMVTEWIQDPESVLARIELQLQDRNK